MPIITRCDCGHRLQVPEVKAGSRVRCPRCGLPVEVPHPADNPHSLWADLQDDDDDVATVNPPKRSPSTKPAHARRPGFFDLLYWVSVILCLLAVFVGSIAFVGLITHVGSDDDSLEFLQTSMLVGSALGTFLWSGMILLLLRIEEHLAAIRERS